MKSISGANVSLNLWKWKHETGLCVFPILIGKKEIIPIFIYFRTQTCKQVQQQQQRLKLVQPALIESFWLLLQIKKQISLNSYTNPESDDVKNHLIIRVHWWWLWLRNEIAKSARLKLLQKKRQFEVVNCFLIFFYWAAKYSSDF